MRQGVLKTSAKRWYFQMISSKIPCIPLNFLSLKSPCPLCKTWFCWELPFPLWSSNPTRFPPKLSQKTTSCLKNRRTKKKKRKSPSVHVSSAQGAFHQRSQSFEVLLEHAQLMPHALPDVTGKKKHLTRQSRKLCRFSFRMVFYTVSIHPFCSEAFGRCLNKQQKTTHLQISINQSCSCCCMPCKYFRDLGWLQDSSNGHHFFFVDSFGML